MITLQASDFDLLNIESELNLKIGGIKELSSQPVLTELSNAVFTIGVTSFIRAINLEAKANPKAFHHLYEWNAVGNPSKRLFFLYKDESVGGRLVIKPGFIKSRSKVPLAPELASSSKSGRFVSTRHIFANKASVMEEGSQIIYRTKKNTPIPAMGKINFVAAGTIIRINHPGGIAVKGSFEKFFNVWFATKLQAAINRSGVIKSIDKETAKILNVKGAGSKQVVTAVVNLLKQYSKDKDVL